MGCVASCCVLLCECACCGVCCAGKLCDCMLSQAVRVGHILLMIAVFILASILGTDYISDLEDIPHGEIELGQGCDHGDGAGRECKYRQMIYRASLACVVLFAALAVLSPFLEAVNRSMWPVKIATVFGLFIWFWWEHNSTFTHYSKAARILSFVWLLVQSLFLVDFAHDIHDLLGAQIEEAEKNDQDKKWKLLYLLLSVGFFIASFIGIALMYENYAGCGIGQFFVTLTLIVGVITSLLSIWERINLGILTPSIMFAYMVFLCWYALLQSPHEGCNPTATQVTTDEGSVAMTIIIIVTIVVLGWMVGAGSKILTIFNPEGTGVMTGKSAGYSAAGHKMNSVLTGVQDSQPTSANNDADDENDASAPLCGTASDPKSSGPPQERTFFFVLMVIAATYGAMILTNWGAPNGSSKADNEKTSNESMWLIIVAQWVTMAMYLRIIQVNYNENDS